MISSSIREETDGDRLLRILGFDLICKNSEVQLARGIQLEFLFAIKQWQTLSTQVI